MKKERPGADDGGTEEDSHPLRELHFQNQIPVELPIKENNPLTENLRWANVLTGNSAGRVTLDQQINR